MIALGIILVLLILLLLTSVGVEVHYESAFRLRLKIGVLKCTLIPGKKKAAKKKPEKKPSGHKVGKAEKKPKQKISVQEILELVRIGLKALGRLRRSLSIDVLRLYVLVAADDPYDAVLRYGVLNAGLGVLAPLAHNALKIRSEDVRTNVDVQGAESSVELQLTATLQIWEILWIAICAGCAFLSWNRKRKKKQQAVKNTKEEKAS